MVPVCGLCISTLVANLVIAAGPQSCVRSNQLVLPVTEAGAKSWPAGTVRMNPMDGQEYVWIPPGEFEIGCSPGDNECKGSERGRQSVTVKITHGF